MVGKRPQRPRVTINYQLNENIVVDSMLVIGPTGEKLGVQSKTDALVLANDYGLDLYVVTPAAAKQQVAKILDYGKLKYQQAKQAKVFKKKQFIAQNHTLRLRVGTDIGDLRVKIKKSREFLLAGHRVKIALRFRGREVTKPDIGYRKLEQMFTELQDVAVMEHKIEKSAMFLNMNLAPITVKTKKQSKEAASYAKNQK